MHNGVVVARWLRGSTGALSSAQPSPTQRPSTRDAHAWLVHYTWCCRCMVHDGDMMAQTRLSTWRKLPDAPASAVHGVARDVDVMGFGARSSATSVGAA